MSSTGDSNALGRASLHFAKESDVDLFVETLGRFERGEIGADAWRAFRLIHGVYGQRQDDVQMIRVKVPQGILSSPQLEALADVAEAYSRGFLHVTTRQNVQYHFVRLSDAEAALRRLLEAGLTTREACGNTVRNVTTCAFAGVAPDETFDVTPYAEALTRHLLRHPLSSTLPRKFKIAFEGCAEDHGVTSINDLGFRAAEKDGIRGFRVTAGGGTGTLPTAGRLLFEFLPAADLLTAAEAVLGVFHRLGDREHRERNRMKFLIRQMGFRAFHEEVLGAFAALGTAPGATGPRLPFDPERAPEQAPPSFPRPAAPTIGDAERASRAALRGPGLLPAFPSAAASGASFAASNIRPQRQPGFSIVLVTLPLGDVTAPQFRLLARLALAYGDGEVRLTHDQNLVLRWIETSRAGHVHKRLLAAGLGTPGAGSITDVTSCPGAESCRLAVTHSRGLGRLLREFLEGRPDLAALAPELKLKASGCPNGCGHHHLAGIGFQGSARQLEGRAVPQYFVMTGGEVTREETFFAKTVARVPARRIPQATQRLLELFASEGLPGESAPAFFRRIGPIRQKELLSDLERLLPAEAALEDFVDPGQEGEAFTVETKSGECAT
jgi:sulfite reductase (NADPH) hemoprotein beta-component